MISISVCNCSCVLFDHVPVGNLDSSFGIIIYWTPGTLQYILEKSLVIISFIQCQDQICEKRKHVERLAYFNSICSYNSTNFFFLHTCYAYVCIERCLDYGVTLHSVTDRDFPKETEMNLRKQPRVKYFGSDIDILVCESSMHPIYGFKIVGLTL